MRTDNADTKQPIHSIFDGSPMVARLDTAIDSAKHTASRKRKTRELAQLGKLEKAVKDAAIRARLDKEAAR